MKTQAFFRGRWVRAYCMLVVAVMVVGCQTSPDIGAAEHTTNHYQACSEMVTLSTQSIRAGDLAQAREYLQGAAASATTARQQQQVRSLTRLVDGAEALRDGDPDLARAEWARIEEPRLRREVRHKARLIGMDVPTASEGETLR